MSQHFPKYTKNGAGGRAVGLIFWMVGVKPDLTSLGQEHTFLSLELARKPARSSKEIPGTGKGGTAGAGFGGPGITGCRAALAFRKPGKPSGTGRRPYSSVSDWSMALLVFMVAGSSSTQGAGLHPSSSQEHAFSSRFEVFRNNE